jgi:outer membrane protein assembly factor BamB
MLVYAGSGGVVGVDAADGAILWQTTEWKIPIATVPSPVDLGSGRVLLTGGYNAGAMILAISEAAGSGKFEVKIEKVLRTRDFAATQQTPIVRGSQVYAITAGRGSLTCVDGSGQTIWTSGRDETFGLGPLLMAGDLIYALSEEGRLVLAEAGGGEFKKLAAAKVLEGHEAWGPMALAGARLLVRDFTTLRCLDVGATQP